MGSDTLDLLVGCSSSSIIPVGCSSCSVSLLKNVGATKEGFHWVTCGGCCTQARSDCYNTVLVCCRRWRRGGGSASRQPLLPSQDACCQSATIQERKTEGDSSRAKYSVGSFLSLSPPLVPPCPPPLLFTLHRHPLRGVMMSESTQYAAHSRGAPFPAHSKVKGQRGVTKGRSNSEGGVGGRTEPRSQTSASNDACTVQTAWLCGALYVLNKAGGGARRETKYTVIEKAINWKLFWLICTSMQSWNLPLWFYKWNHTRAAISYSSIQLLDMLIKGSIIYIGKWRSTVPTQLRVQSSSSGPFSGCTAAVWCNIQYILYSIRLMHQSLKLWRFLWRTNIFLLNLLLVCTVVCHSTGTSWLIETENGTNCSWGAPEKADHSLMLSVRCLYLFLFAIRDLQMSLGDALAASPGLCLLCKGGQGAAGSGRRAHCDGCGRAPRLVIDTMCMCTEHAGVFVSSTAANISDQNMEHGLKIDGGYSGLSDTVTCFDFFLLEEIDWMAHTKQVVSVACNNCLQGPWY